MNVLGFDDLGGDAREWMWDGLDEKTGKRVIRGGSWYDFAEVCAVAGRLNSFPELRNGLKGFRVALSSVP